MKVELVGSLEHGKPNRLHLFTMTEEHEMGANHIVKILHKFITDVGAQKVLKMTFYVQADRCTKENKNRYFLHIVSASLRKTFSGLQSYLSYLLAAHMESLNRLSANL